MNAAAWVLLGITVLGLVALGLAILPLTRHVAALSSSVAALSSSVAAIADDLDELRRQTLPLLADTRAALRRAEGDNSKVDALLLTAQSITGTVDSASKLAYGVLANPVVKVLALLSGTRRAAGRLREVTDPSGPAVGRIGRARRHSQRARDHRSRGGS